MDSSINPLNPSDIGEKNNIESQTNQSNNNLIIHPALYLIERFSQTIAKIYKEMGLGNYIDYDA